jgi:acetyl esterase/lipase
MALQFLLTKINFLPRKPILWTVIAFFFQPNFALSQAPTYKDIVYATVNGNDLKLDIYMPTGVKAPVLLVWVHGGAWRSGSKENLPKVFSQRGIAIASLDFRQSTEARFPAAIHDIKGAIRFLRAKASEYGYKAGRIAIGGASSGGHLAALVGVSNGNADLEGTVGDYPKQSSRVDAILDYFGASNLTTILDQSTPYGLTVRTPALQLLLGALPQGVPSLAKMASPVFYVDKSDPPLLIFHGDRDPQMPIDQSYELEAKYKKLNLDVHLEVLNGATHGGDVFFQGERLKLALDFLNRNVKSK